MTADRAGASGALVVSITRIPPLAVVTLDNPPVNATGHALRAGLLQAVQALDDDPDIGAAVLICAGRTFVAGADIREFGQPPRPPLLPEVIARLASAAKPWVAAIHGTALGGGLELALGCHYRIAAPDARLGLPEVNLGLIPGAGGTVRLPRLVGPEAALQMIAGGKPVSAAQALDSGLIDAIAPGDLRSAALDLARQALDRPLPAPLDTRPPPALPADWDSRVAAVAARARGQIAPAEAAASIARGLALPAPAAHAAERAGFETLRDGSQSRALRHIFFAEKAAARPPAGGTPRPSAVVGVVGGGTMGAGIAAALLLARRRVIMIERDSAALDAGLHRTRSHIADSLSRGLVAQDAHDAMIAALTGATSHTALADADLVIEAVFEDMDAKRQVFAALDSATRPDAVLATNTSYLDVGAIAATLREPSRALGLHFFAPAHVMKLLEIVRPDTASPDVIATGFALARDLGKVPVLSGVCDGFIGNRIMSAYRREADCMLEDGALPWQVDAAMTEFGFGMGIYAMQDLAGLDIAWAMRQRRAASRDPAERYVEIADRLCAMGRFGRKTGAGWYRYDGGRASPDPLVEDLVRAESARRGIVRQDFSLGQIMDRILRTMQAEGARILDEGIAARPGDIDVVMVNGYGFPRWRGGPMFLHGAAPT